MARMDAAGLSRGDIDSVTPEEMLKARRALKAFRDLQPTLTSYAQMLTGRKDVRVVAAVHDNGSTDGKKIYYRPPIELGEPMIHSGWMCDRRLPNGVPACEACARREKVLVTIYHEIAHIVFDSFQKVRDYHKQDALTRAIAEVGTKYAKKVEARIKATPPSMMEGYMGLAEVVSPFLPLLVNALEDARVNTSLFRAMPGARVMFEAECRRVLREGVEQLLDDGTWGFKKWSEYPLNAQIMCAILCIASGYSIDGLFDEKVLDAMEDEQLFALVRKGAFQSSVADVYGLSFPILARLRELGFCRTDEDPEEEEPPPFEKEKGESSDESEDGTGDDDSGDGESESGSENSDEESSDESESGGGTGTGQGGQPGTDPDSNGTSDAKSDESGQTRPDSPPNNDSERPSEDTDDSSVQEGSEGSTESDSESPQESGGGDGHDMVDDSSDMERGEDDEAGDGQLEDDVSDSDSSNSGGSTESGTDSGDDVHDDGSEMESGDGESPEPGTQPEPGSDGSDDAGDGREEPTGPQEYGDYGTYPGEEDDDGDELIDLGAYDRQAGRIVGNIDLDSKDDGPDMGTPEETKVAIRQLGDHEHPEEAVTITGDAAVKLAIIQGVYFEAPSREVLGVMEYRYPEGGAWMRRSAYGYAARQIGKDGDFTPPESAMAPALTRARVIFADNARAKMQRHMKSGKVNSRVLGKRAPLGDPRLFQKKRLPGKQSYFVLIGLDVSMSTSGVNLDLIKRAAMMEAELMHRLGIPFAVLAHSGEYEQLTGMMNVTIFEVKGGDEPWTNQTRDRLSELGPTMANLDGHTFEYYYKYLEQQSQETKILHYYTDGAMPLENYDEELEILTKYIRLMRMAKFKILGVGVRTDSPKAHGLETIEINAVEDLMLVLRRLETQLTE